MMEEQTAIEQQPLDGHLPPIPVQAGQEDLTPVFGTAQPSHGLPGAIRLEAYRHSAQDPLRWLLLLVADRVDVAGYMAREATTPDGWRLLVRRQSRLMQAHPKAYLAALIGGAVFVGTLWRRLWPAGT